MELRHIRYFLAVAEEGNFTRAAARVGIGQPPLSQQIRDLEAEVGTALFRRLPHGAELTAAGEAFRAVVEGMPAQAQLAITRAQRAARGETGVLRIGFTSGATMNPVVPGTIRAFRRHYPEVQLGLSEANSTHLAQGLREGALDVAFMRPTGIDRADMHMEPLPDEPMVVALPAGHPLASDGAITLAHLREDPFLCTPRAIGPTLFDAAVEACRAAGFTPRFGPAAPQLASVLSLVAADQGFSIVPASMRQLALEGVVYCDMADVHPVARLALVHLRGARSVLLRNFLAVARRDRG